MKKVFLLISVLLGILVVGSSCVQPQPTPPPPGALLIEVSRYGFNNTQGEFRLEVEEGQEVEITFVYGDGDLAQNNPHIIAIPDYGIETGPLDRDNPEVTVSFIAEETGEVVFMCIQTTCVGHHNLHDDEEEEDHHES